VPDGPVKRHAEHPLDLPLVPEADAERESPGRGQLRRLRLASPWLSQMSSTPAASASRARSVT
jgi:hypothetical protein